MNLSKPKPLKHLQVMLSAMAMVLCLYAASSLHQHESGYHALQSNCVICDIESLLTHGVMTSHVSLETPDFLSIAYSSHLQSLQYTRLILANTARAPPFLLLKLIQ